MTENTLFLLALTGVLLLAFMLRDLAARGWQRPRGRLQTFRSRAAAAWRVGRSSSGLGTSRGVACMVREAKGQPCACGRPGCHGAICSAPDRHNFPSLYPAAKCRWCKRTVADVGGMA